MENWENRALHSPEQPAAQLQAVVMWGNGDSMAKPCKGVQSLTLSYNILFKCVGMH